MDCIYDGLYYEVSDLANDIANKAAKYLSKKVEYIRCSDIEQYMTEVENIEFIDYKFKNNLNKVLLGSISKVQDEFIITTNKNLSDEYKNFTKMHEIIHYYRDYTYLSKSHAFSDFILQKDYLPEDFDKEVAADIGASILMANDRALKYALLNFKNFNSVVKHFAISKKVLKTRIFQYLEFAENHTYKSSYQLFRNYYYNSCISI
ncbi:ImmA/IrrE family metallo-endopeptidase [Enterococcus mundtii]|uniref:ImmA/IrrE family metallo-endopeptidase n=1 Tax=Enterococcus mundtii TaxID=53346 RepID=UPI000824F4FF|nr:toxin [Enterococcus mundtii]